MKRSAWLLVAALAVAHLALAAALPLSGDEAYHWWWAIRPAAGYHEHPPLQAWLIRACLELFGHTAWAVRLPALLAGAAVPPLLVALARRLAREAGVPEPPATGLLVASALPPLSFLLAAYANNDMLFIAPALGALWLADRARDEDAPRAAAFIAPALFALALLSKWTALMLLPALLHALAGVPRDARARLRAGTLAGLALLAPALLWNARHGWPQFGIRIGHQTRQWRFMQFPLELFGGELAGLGPVLLAGGLWWLWTGRRAPGRLARTLWLAGLGVAGAYHLMVFRQHVDFHWPLAGMLAALPALWALQPRWRRPLVLSAIAAAALVAALVLRLSAGGTPTLPYAERPRLAKTSRFASELTGWPELRARLRDEEAALPPGDFILADGYGLLSQALFLVEGRREGYLVEVPFRSGGSFGYREAALRPNLGAGALYLDERGGRGEAETRRKLLLLFETVEPLPPVNACRGAACREFVMLRLKNFRGFARRADFYAPREVARAAGYLDD